MLQPVVVWRPSRGRYSRGARRGRPEGPAPPQLGVRGNERMSFRSTRSARVIGMAAPRSGRRTRLWRALLPVLALALVTLALAGCSTGNPQSTIDPKGPYARTIYDLFVNWIFWPA